MRIKSERVVKFETTYRLSFSHNGAGFSFECDKDGHVDTSKLHPCALKNYNQCLTGYITRMEDVVYDIGTNEEGDVDYIPRPGTGVERTYPVKGKIVSHNHRQIIPAVGECDDCGRDVHLSGFTNTCECGCDYNMSGQHLAPRSQWGEETGESLSDILAIA